MTSFPFETGARYGAARHRVTQGALFGAALTAALGAANLASAQDQVECASLPGPIVYGRGGSASSVLFGRFAVAIAESSDPFTVVYKDDGACYAMTSLVEGEKLTGTAKYWERDEDGKIVAKTCTLPLDQADGIEASWGAMAQQASTCAGIEGLPDDVGDYIGPVSGFSIIVPVQSTQQVISAEAVYHIYGLGVEDPKYQVEPWTVKDAVASRTTTSAAGLLLAKSVGIPLSHTLYGTDTRTNQGSIDFITKTSPAAVANPEAAIGFCSSETVDANREVVRTLAFQAVGQEYGYWPDSTATAFDKINIRQGRYWLWNPHHVYVRLNAQGEIADPVTAKWVGYVTGTLPLPPRDDTGKPELAVDLQAEVGTVPLCAMEVTRDGDVGPLASFQHDEPCGCYYEFKVTGTAPAACQPCETNDDCSDSAPVCRYGFCEVK